MWAFHLEEIMGLRPEKRTVNRGGKTFEQTFHVGSNSEPPTTAPTAPAGVGGPRVPETPATGQVDVSTAYERFRPATNLTAWASELEDKIDLRNTELYGLYHPDKTFNEVTEHAALIREETFTESPFNSEIVSQIQAVGFLRAEHAGSGTDENGNEVDYYRLPALAGSHGEDKQVVIRHVKVPGEPSRTKIGTLPTTPPGGHFGPEDFTPRWWAAQAALSESSDIDLLGESENFSSYTEEVTMDDDGKPVALRFVSRSGQWYTDRGGAVEHEF